MSYTYVTHKGFKIGQSYPDYRYHVTEIDLRSQILGGPLWTDIDISKWPAFAKDSYRDIDQLVLAINQWLELQSVLMGAAFEHKIETDI